MLTAYLSGFLLDYLDKRTVFLITGVFPFCNLIGSLFMKEKRIIYSKDDKKLKIYIE